ncbi:MAG: 4-hydroxy-tetrahydrodipicolinate reductase [Rhodospirillales bacterium]|nr:4-hydroxy-tetrahydrodipicolinate reductase [Rhodospirillales bacterium]
MKIGIVGCGGRMGRMLMRQILDTDGCELSGGTELPDSPMLGEDLGDLIGVPGLGVVVTDDAAALFAASDAIIDFTLPTATRGHAELAAANGTILVVGTTGLGEVQLAALEAAAKKTAVIKAPNFSVGVNLLFALTRKVTETLDEDFDIEIVEMHHRHKVDAPSGTALGLGRAAALGRNVDLDDVAEKVRDGHTGERRRGDIGFATLRGGDVVGDHTVVFAGPGERVELTHKASGREIFARGAVRAAMWAKGKTPGLYSMLDVLGFGD